MKFFFLDFIVVVVDLVVVYIIVIIVIILLGPIISLLFVHFSNGKEAENVILESAHLCRNQSGHYVIILVIVLRWKYSGFSLASNRFLYETSIWEYRSFFKRIGGLELIDFIHFVSTRPDISFVVLQIYETF